MKVTKRLRLVYATGAAWCAECLPRKSGAGEWVTTCAPFIIAGVLVEPEPMECCGCGATLPVQPIRDHGRPALTLETAPADLAGLARIGGAA